MHMRKSQKFGFEKSRAPRKPLRTAVEMAEEFGITTNKLTRLLNTDPAGPRPKLDHKGTVRAVWYDPVEVRAWWAKRQAVPQEATGATA